MPIGVLAVRRWLGYGSVEAAVSDSVNFVMLLNVDNTMVAGDFEVPGGWNS